MLLLARPPYLRWVIAMIIVVGAIVWEISKEAEAPFPFARVDIAAGTRIDRSHLEWRPMPAGYAPAPELATAVARVGVAAGDPITRSVAGPPSPIPEGWWSVPVSLPRGVGHGTRVRLALPDGRSTPGVVDVPGSEDAFGVERAGAVAVPEAYADLVAGAARDQSLVVMLLPTGQRSTNEMAPNATQ